MSTLRINKLKEESYWVNLVAYAQRNNYPTETIAKMIVERVKEVGVIVHSKNYDTKGNEDREKRR